ncbi:MAG: hypothetical protein ACU833_09245 [Gammaproteobacteria bacterium]
MLITKQNESAKFYNRIRIYLKEMYPVPSRLLFAGLVYIAIAVFSNRIYRQDLSIASFYTAIGVMSLFFQFLILRLMDELKDAEIDRKLFGERPLPSGRIYREDIVFGLCFVISVYLTFNLWIGEAFWTAAFVLSYQFLMFKHFFRRDLLERSLPMTLATHNPIIPIMFLHGFHIAAIERDIGWQSISWGWTLLFVAMLWLAGFAWEISRKIKGPKEENEYVTYSRIWGPKKAVAVAWGAQTAAALIAYVFYRVFDLPPVFNAILLAGYLPASWRYSRFLLTAGRHSSRFRPYSETFMIALLLAVIIGFDLTVEPTP